MRRSSSRPARRAKGGGQNQFPCSSTTIRPGALPPELVPDQQLLADDNVVWRDPQTGQFLLAFSAGIENLGAGTMNAVGYRDRIAGTGDLPNPNTMPAYQRIFHADGSCDEVQIGTLTYHDVHHHYHLDGVMNYELLDAQLNPVKPNWEDIYDKMLFGQNFDVTDLMNRPQAQYYIRQTVDAAGIIFEQNDGNNTVRVPVTLGIGVPYRWDGRGPGSRSS